MLLVSQKHCNWVPHLLQENTKLQCFHRVFLNLWMSFVECSLCLETFYWKATHEENVICSNIKKKKKKIIHTVFLCAVLAVLNFMQCLKGLSVWLHYSVDVWIFLSHFMPAKALHVYETMLWNLYLRQTLLAKAVMQCMPQHSVLRTHVRQPMNTHSVSW